MFWHIFTNKMKTLLRDKSLIFWTLLFPIVLSTLFNLAFSNISEIEKWGKINIAVVKIEENKNLELIINNFSKKTDYQIFNTQYVNEEEAMKLLENDKISGYIKIGQETEIVAKENSLEQTIIKYIVDQYYQMLSVTKNSLEYNTDALSNGVLKVFNEHKSYILDTSNKNTDYSVNYFYTLIGMTCLFGGFFGLYTVNETEVNLSKKGARIAVSPVKKITVLLAGFLSGIIVQYIEILILMAYLIFVLGINFGNKVGYIFITTFFGVLAGITTGIFIGVISKKDHQTKSMILAIFTMICSFLAGMMIVDIKYLISKNAPILAKINPVNMITDALYSLYSFNTLDRFWQNNILLIIYTVCIMIISYFFIRRKKYDSI